MRIGDTPTSKPLRAWLAAAPQLLLDPQAVWHEPTRAAETIVQAAPGPLCGALATRLDAAGLRPAQEWLAAWREADDLVPPAAAGTPEPFEGRAYTALADAAPAGSVLWVASSMPVRDFESFLTCGDARLQVLANRGANGIDGTISSALGAALGSGARTFVACGELALLHDVSGLAAARRAGVELTILCVNNGGGGIFDFLPVSDAANAEMYEAHIATPADVEPSELAAIAGLRHTLVGTAEEIVAAAAEPGLIEVRTDRAENVALHRALFARVAEQLS